MYHGTPLESALKILKEGSFRGTKKLPHHQHAYISFSSSFESAKDFGEIIFTVQPLPTFIEVDYENQEWMRNNQEIVEYVGVWYDDEEKTKEELHAIQFESEYVVKDLCPWKEVVTGITIYTNEKEDVEQKRNLLLELVGEEIPIQIKRKKERLPSDFEKKQWADLAEQIKKLEEQINSAR
jgi:hypothetical protein